MKDMNIVVCKRDLVKVYDCLCGFNFEVRVVEADVFAGILVLPEGIKTVRSEAFTEMPDDIHTVVIPKSVKKIEANAFKGVRKVVMSERASFKGLKVEDGWDNGIEDLVLGETLKSFIAYCVVAIKEKLKK